MLKSYHNYIGFLFYWNFLLECFNDTKLLTSGMLSHCMEFMLNHTIVLKF